MIKKISALYVLAVLPYVSFAQSTNGADVNSEIFHICTSIFVVVLVIAFIVTILKIILNHSIKKKIIDKGISEPMASLLLKNNGEAENTNIKWFCILAGLGVAFILINYWLPLGVHSLAIMSLCLAASFLIYHFIQNRNRQE